MNYFTKSTAILDSENKRIEDSQFPLYMQRLTSIVDRSDDKTFIVNSQPNIFIKKILKLSNSDYKPTTKHNKESEFLDNLLRPRFGEYTYTTERIRKYLISHYNLFTAKKVKTFTTREQLSEYMENLFGSKDIKYFFETNKGKKSIHRIEVDSNPITTYKMLGGDTLLQVEEITPIITSVLNIGYFSNKSELELV